MAEYLIPLTPEPQSLGITLAGRELRLLVRWCDAPQGGWLLDILEPESATPLLCGVPLVAGCDLLAPHGHLELGGELWLDSDISPTFEDLGEHVRLYFVTDGEEAE